MLNIFYPFLAAAACSAHEVCDGCEDRHSLLQVQDKQSRREGVGLDLRASIEDKQSVRSKSWKEAWDEDPSMFEGCSKVFIDVGSNAGTHIRKLFEPEKYPNSIYLKVFDDAFGDSSFRGQASATSGICAFGFEANPRWEPRYREIEAAYSKQGWRARWFAPVLVSNETGSGTFYLNSDDKHNDWASSMIFNRGKNDSVSVPEIELAQFLEALKSHAAAGYKLMKMDIEGAEFYVLPDLIKNKLLCEGSLDEMTIEWHARFLTSNSSLQAAKNVIEQVQGPGKCSPSKDTKVRTLDDESYLRDGIPLP